MNLDQIRNQIDDIDDQMIDLMCRRMDCAKQVADYKRQNHLPVFDQAREARILEKVAGKAGEYGRAVQMIYSSMMEQSRAIQYPLTASDSLGSFVNAKEASQVQKVACQGIEGAYAHLTAQQLYPNAQVLFYDTWEQVCCAVDREEVEYGILPVENSWAGSVHDVYDLLIGGNFSISVCADAHIHHNLIGLPDADLSSIRTVLSHPQALAQCCDYIDQKGYEKEEINNTAKAVRLVAEKNDKTVAAIGSAYAAKAYGLSVLERGIASSRTNTTRFVSICKHPERQPQAEKISIVLSVKHESGGLYHLLASFASCGMNITKIESRPIKSSQFEYLFYMDMNGNLSDKTVSGVLSTVQGELPYFKLLGNYPEYAITLL